MRKAIGFLCAFVVLLSCNTAKHLEKQQKAIESLTNKVNASKIIQIQDSIVYKEGAVKTFSDTAVIWNNIGDTIIKEYHYRNDYYQKDTLKIYQQDARLIASERALYSENEKNKALLIVSEKGVKEWKADFYKLLVIVLCVFTGLLFLIRFKIL